MIKPFTSFLSLLVLLGCNSPSAEQQEASAPEQPAPEKPNTLTQAEKEEGWQLLFDGSSTGAWRKYNQADFPEKGWVVKDDALVIEKAPKPRPEGFGGDIITREKFGDFELVLDFMLSDTANSGIFYFVTEEEGVPIYFNAPEYQLLDDPTYIATGQTTEGAAHLTGSNYDMEPCQGNFLRPVGEWNTARIVHKSGHVEHWLNGQKCLEYDVGSDTWKNQYNASKFKEYPNYAQAKEGHIGLQDHDYEVRFRNMKIRGL